MNFCISTLEHVLLIYCLKCLLSINYNVFILFESMLSLYSSYLLLLCLPGHFNIFTAVMLSFVFFILTAVMPSRAFFLQLLCFHLYSSYLQLLCLQGHFFLQLLCFQEHFIFYSSLAFNAFNIVIAVMLLLHFIYFTAVLLTISVLPITLLNFSGP